MRNAENSSNLGPKTGFFLCARKDAEAPRKHFFAEGLAEARVFRNSGYQQSSKPFRGSRSRNSAEKTFAEAAVEGGNELVMRNSQIFGFLHLGTRNSGKVPDFV